MLQNAHIMSNEKAHNSKETIQEAAKEFKKTSCYKCQFLLSNKINTKLIPYQDTYRTSRKEDAHRLYDNMVLLGLKEDIRYQAWLKFQFEEIGITRSPTHHIIPTSLFDDTIHQLLESKGINIDINDTRNGIILPPKKNSTEHFTKGISHALIHHPKHYGQYKQQIMTVINSISTESELWEALDHIKEQLYNGTFKL